MFLHREYNTVPNLEGELEFAILYEKGKGYVLIVIPVKRTKVGGFTMTESGAYTGYRMTVVPAERRSKANLDKSIQYINTNKETLISNYVKMHQ